MAYSFCRAKAISRTASGGSAVAAAAYRAGENLHDEENGRSWKYEKDEVTYSKITLPKNAPPEFADRETLWNSVQKTEKNSDSRLARELVIGFPHELSQEQAMQIIDDFSEYLAKKGMCVDANVHWKNGNHHAHVMLTTRKLDKNGRWAKWKERKEFARDENGNKIPLLDKNGNQKLRVREGHGTEKLWKRVSVLVDEWSKQTEYESWKKELAGMMNRELEKIGVSDKVDYRSYKERGIDKVPQVHEGFAARAIESKGGTSYLCKHNREVRALNAKIDNAHEIEKRIAELKKEQENEQKLNKNHSEVTICTFADLTANEKKAAFKVASDVIEKGTRHFKTGRATVKDNAIKNFINNSVFAKNQKGSFYLFPSDKKKATENGLLKNNIKANNKDATFKTPPRYAYEILSNNHLKSVLKLPPPKDNIKTVGGAGLGAPSKWPKDKFPVSWDTLSDIERERILAKIEFDKIMGADDEEEISNGGGWSVEVYNSFKNWLYMKDLEEEEEKEKGR